MCRWAVYLGMTPSHADTLFLKPDHSLVVQSYKPPYTPGVVEDENHRLRNHGENLDGYGIGIYQPNELVFISKSGNAITDENHEVDPHLKTMIRTCSPSTVMFAHIRAKYDGESNELNSHPFSWHNMLFLHNGGIGRFNHLKPNLLLQLTDYERSLIRGTTDSEHAFALFTHFLLSLSNQDHVIKQNDRNLPFENLTLSHYVESMKLLIKELDGVDDDPFRDELGELECASSSVAASSLNFAISDGKHFVATRYRSCMEELPPTLYMATGKVWDPIKGMSGGEVESVVIASEPLVKASNWELIAKDELISGTVDKQNGRLVLNRECLSSVCHSHKTELAGAVVPPVDSLLLSFLVLLLLLSYFMFWKKIKKK